MTTQSALPTETSSPPPPRQRARRALLVLLGAVVVLLAGAYAVAFTLVGGGVPRGTTVRGVEIGGLSAHAAEQRLRAGLAERTGAPIRVALDGETATLAPAEAGLTVDAAATVDRAGHRSPDPVDLWHALTGPPSIEPVVAVDQHALDAAVARLAQRFDRAPRDGRVAFRGAQVVSSAPVVGRTLDRADAARKVRDAFLRNPGVLRLRATRTGPKVGAAEVQRAVTQVARPAVAAPVVLRLPGRSVTVAPATIGAVLTLQADRAGRLQPTLDRAAFGRALAPSLAGLSRQPRDASIRIVGGRPQVVPSADGVTLDQEKLSAALLAALPKPAPRVATVPLTVRKADLTTAEAQALGVTEKIAEFTTHHPYAPARVGNIHRAADIVDGTLLLPGEVFSLNDVVGERTRARGFNEAPVIEGGRLVKGFGGGVSQLATTTFNAMFFAGLDEIEHKPHSFYISRYPEGREATVAWRSVDLKFRNDSGHGVLIDTAYTNTSITVRMWGTKRYDVEATKSARYNVRGFTTKYDPRPSCVPQGGEQGFSVDVGRILKQGGRVVQREQFHTVYQPEDRVICAARPGGAAAGPND